MTDLTSRLKEVSGALAGAGAVLYVFGYLMVRSRSRALGTDPDFALIDEAYVFAGARFAMITTIALLVTAPIVIGVRYAARRIADALPTSALGIVQGITVSALALLTLVLLFALLASDGLLACNNSVSWRQNNLLRDAVIGTNRFGVVAVLIATCATALSTAWLWEHRRSASPNGLILPALVALIAVQSFLLPLQVGAFFPNLRTRELARVPNGLNDLDPPLWIVDRGVDRTVLLARGNNNRLSFVTIKTEALDGIPTTDRSLKDILGHGDSVCSAASSPHSG